MKQYLQLPQTTLFVVLTLLVSVVFGQRVSDDVVAAFYFSEGDGDIIADHSGNGAPIILVNENPNAISWLPNGGLAIESATSLTSANSVSKVINQVTDGTGITLEAWVEPGQIDQSGPARIFTYSFGYNNRNFMLGQNGNRYVARMRTSNTDSNGMPNFQTASGSVNGQLQHLIYTWDSTTGNEFLYLNGVQVNAGNRTGTLVNWDEDYKICIGNEIDADRPWLGNIHLAAVYSRALSTAEVSQNFEAGLVNQSSVSQESCEEDCFVDGFGINRRVLWIPNLPNNMFLEFEFTEAGAQFETFDDGTAHLSGAMINMQDPEAGFYLDVWLSDRMNWNDWSALGRGWKGNAALVGNLYQTWDYFIVDPDQVSSLTGFGSLEGSYLNLTHKPSNYYYGFQVGLGANDQNLEQGMSCWYYAEGIVNGQSYSGECDTNLEGDCLEMPVLNCAVDITVSCEQGLDPTVTGSPILGCEDAYTLTYSDIIAAADCPYIVERTWTATDAFGEQIVCTQTITVIDNEAPVIAVEPVVLANCESNNEAFAYAVNDNCDENPEIEINITDSIWTSLEPCAPGMFRTQTPGGWGAVPSGNNPGTYLHEHFDQAFPDGLTIGCENTLTLTSAQAITDFLPSGGSPSALPAGTLSNPGQNYSNTLASHIVAITLSSTFDSVDPDFGSSELGLGQLLILEGEFAGWSVAELLQVANEVIGGCASNYSYSSLTNALSSINENFVDGELNNGFLDCQLGLDCFLMLNADITVTDNCGNSSSNSASVWISDTTAPEFPDMPTQITVSCDNIPEPQIDVLDECFSELVTLSFEQTEYSGGCGTSLQYTWTATDQCGNQSSFTQFVTVIDEEAPVITAAPANMTLNCGEDLPLQWPVASDNCDNDLLMSYTDEIIGEGCDFVVVRTFFVTDNCGNTTTTQHSIAVSDNEAPVISGIDAAISLSCNDVLPQQEPVVVDNCDAQPLIGFNENSTVDECGTNYTRVWTAVDQCGNQAVFTQVIEIGDNAAPQFLDDLDDYSINCEMLPELVLPAIQDDCSAAELTFTETWQQSEGSCAVLVRTFIATDACGNSSVMVQNITLLDEEAPALIGVPGNANVSCGEISDPQLVTAIDNCDSDVNITYSEQLSGSGCSLIMLRTWTASDDCGNTTVATQTLNVSDNAAPVFISAPQDLTLSCGFYPPLETPMVQDDCTPVVNIVFSETTEELGCETLITRTWTASDACGNLAVHTQFISLIDDQGPVFTNIPPSYEISCGMNPFLEDAIATDNCSAFTMNLSMSSFSDECGTTLIRTWTATDDCGNSSQASQTIFIGDISAPVISGVSPNQTIECDEDLPAIQDPLVQDECSNVDLTFAENVMPGACPQEYTLLRTWTAIDACGNTSVAAQQIFVLDTTPPVFNQTPQDIYPECGNIPEPMMLTATDNCGAVNVSFNQTSIGGGCPHLVRTWIAMDECGNTAMAVQHIYVQDNDPPLILGIPGNIEATCNSIPEMPVPEVSDNCDEQVAVTVNQSIVGTGCEYLIIRTWVASDDCGNTTIVSQSIHVTDEAAPVFAYAPANVSLECAELAALPYPPAFDDCSATVNISHDDEIIGGGCEYDILRTYTAVDVCGNSATATQLIHVYDQSPPQLIGVPANLYVDCSNVPAPANVQAVDACSEVISLEFNEQQFGAGCNYYLQRTWTATDACGNATSLTHLVYVNDNYAPTIQALPVLTVDCNEAWPEPQVPAVSDNCTLSPVLNYIEFLEEDGCDEILTRVWTATDNCGNVQTRIQYVYRIDATPPTMSGIPVNIETTCDAIPAPALVTASDNCNNAIVWMEETVIPGNCPYSIVRTWYATDGCGNTSSASQTILVHDDETPILSNLPFDMQVTCENIPAPEFPEASDNCFTGINVMMTEEWIGTENCTFTIVRTFSATDLCGNAAVHVQTIEVVDNEAPQLAQLAEEIVVECDQLPNFDMIAVVDNCDPEPEVQMEEVLVEGDCPTQQSILRIWTATDACGNTSTVSQLIHVVDHSMPELIGVPEDITVGCNEIPELPEVTAWDDCQGELPVTFTETVEFLSEDDGACHLGTTISPAGNVAIWLPGLDGFNTMYVFDAEGGYLTENPANGTAVITGNVFNPNNANQGFAINIQLENRRNWDQWSALGRSYKDDLGFGEAHYQDWTYYEIVNGESTLTGIGEFEGSVLELSHAPSNFYYGLQIGWGANNRNDAYGMSGWFDFSGVLNGSDVSGAGDVMTENNCCPEQNIIRTWTTVDCAGNITTHTQVISVTNTFPLQPLMYYATSEEGEFDVWVNPAGVYQLTFRLPADMVIQIDIYDVNGNLLETVYSGQVEGETDYVVIVPKGRLASGAYVFKLSGDGIQLTTIEFVSP